MSAIVSVAAVVVDCRRSAPLAAFYQAAFGGEIFRTDEDSAWLRTGGLTVIFRGFTHQTPNLSDWLGRRWLMGQSGGDIKRHAAVYSHHGGFNDAAQAHVLK
jgi:hypothetical protein